ncbi:MAG: hypothetical protein AB8G22_03280 [Saprospiraceae bacterium]
MKNTLENNVRILFERRRKMHPNDPAAYKYWDELTELLSQNQDQTIHFFNECSEEEVLLLSEVFEDIAERLKSLAYIATLEKVQVKFPKLDLYHSIEVAKKHSGLF